MNDTHFRLTVDALYNMIEQMELSPSEVREAGMMAAILFDQRHPKVLHWPMLSMSPEQMRSYFSKDAK